MKVSLSDKKFCSAVFAALTISKPFVFAAVDVSYKDCAEYGPNSAFTEKGKLHPNFDCSKFTDECLIGLRKDMDSNPDAELSSVRRYCDGSVPAKTLSFQHFEGYAAQALIHADGPKRNSDQRHETIASKFEEFMGKTGANCQSLLTFWESVKDDGSLEIVSESCFKKIKQPFEYLNKNQMGLLPSFAWKYLSSKIGKDSVGTFTLSSKNFSLFLFELDPVKQSETLKNIASQIGLCHPDSIEVLHEDCKENLIMKLFVPETTISKLIGSATRSFGQSWSNIFNEAIPQLEKKHFSFLNPFDFFPNHRVDSKKLLEHARSLKDDELSFLKNAAKAMSLLPAATLVNLSPELFDFLSSPTDSSKIKAYENIITDEDSPPVKAKFKYFFQKFMAIFDGLNQISLQNLSKECYAVIIEILPEKILKLVKRYPNDSAITSKIALSLDKFPWETVKSFDDGMWKIFYNEEKIDLYDAIDNWKKGKTKTKSRFGDLIDQKSKPVDEAEIYPVLIKRLAFFAEHPVQNLITKIVESFVSHVPQETLKFYLDHKSAAVKNHFASSLCPLFSSMNIGEINKGFKPEDVFPFLDCDKFEFSQIFEAGVKEMKAFIENFLLPGLGYVPVDKLDELSNENFAKICEYAASAKSVDIDGALRRYKGTRGGNFLKKIVKHGHQLFPYIGDVGISIIASIERKDLKELLLSKTPNVNILRSLVNYFWADLDETFKNSFTEVKDCPVGAGKLIQELKTVWIFKDPTKISAETLNNMTKQQLESGLVKHYEEVAAAINSRSEAGELEQLGPFFHMFSQLLNLNDGCKLASFDSPVLSSLLKFPKSKLVSLLNTLADENFKYCPDFKDKMIKIFPTASAKIVNKLSGGTLQYFIKEGVDFKDIMADQDENSLTEVVGVLVDNIEKLDMKKWGSLALERLVTKFAKESLTDEKLLKAFTKNGNCKISGEALSKKILDLISRFVSKGPLADICCKNVSKSAIPESISDYSESCTMKGSSDEKPSDTQLVCSEAEITRTSGSSCQGKKVTLQAMSLEGYKSPSIAKCLQAMEMTLKDALGGITLPVFNKVHPIIFSLMDKESASSLSKEILGALTEDHLNMLPEASSGDPESSAKHACAVLTQKNTLESMTSVKPENVKSICQKKGFIENSSSKMAQISAFIALPLLFLLLV